LPIIGEPFAEQNPCRLIFRFNCKSFIHNILRSFYRLISAIGIALALSASADTTESQMTAKYNGMGERIVQAARRAAELHLRLTENLEFGRNAPVGLAAAGLVKDGLPSTAVSGGHSPGSPWIRAGKDPAGSF
jgi:hypothetical protein